MTDPIDTSKLGPIKHQPDRQVAMSFTDAEWFDIRTALLAAAATADAVMLRHSGEDREILNQARWSYLNLAERIADQ